MLKPKTIDDYIANYPEEQRRALETMRATVRSAAPEAVEVISYGVPMLKVDGRGLVAFGAAKGVVSFYPMNATLVRYHKNELTRYKTSTGTIHFPMDEPLPKALVRKLVKERVKENKARSKG